jgi:alpha-tubulin suppressor-like RCC1 family protein
VTRPLWLPLTALLSASCGFDASLLVEDTSPGADAASDAPVLPDAAFDGSPGVVTLFAVGEYSTCAVVRGRAFCWGAKTDSGSDFQPSPARVDLPEALIQVAAGRAHACGVSATGAVYCWGDNERAQLASSDPTSVGPLRVFLPARARSVSCGDQHNCAILDDGTLWCWGSNAESQLGTAELSLGPVVANPTQVGIANDYFHASCGQGHSCALRQPGALWCWGRNTVAQLGLGTLEPGQAVTPLRVGTDEDWVEVSSAQEGSCGSKRDGRIFCWGSNVAGRVGAGTDVALSPLEIGAGGYTNVATSTFHTCATKTDGALWCWGRNVEGQLGAGHFDAVIGAVQASGSGYVDVGVGRFHTCAADATGSLLCAGKNDVGQLGLGDTTRRAELIRVPFE